MKKENKFLKYFLILVMVAMVVASGCKDDDDDVVVPAEPAFTTLKAYLTANSMDLNNILDGWITSAEGAMDTVNQNFPNHYVMDLRSAADFAIGHISGAVNTTLGTLLADAANNGGKPILVVCYTGQTAGHAVVALRLSGYSDAKVLKWGMSCWNSQFDKWTPNIGDTAIGHASWTNDPIATASAYGDPTITSTATDGATILAERVTALLTGGFKGVLGADVLTTPTNYYINNYWAAADVTTYGHITGAYRINPLTLAGGEYSNLDPTKTIVTYCWTGQTSSMITAYLTVLGYDAKSLKFGANSMIHTNLTAHKWSASGNYTFVTGP